MTVGELIEKLDLIDRECPVLIIDENNLASDVRVAELDPYFDYVATDNSKTPFCIKTY